MKDCSRIKGFKPFFKIDQKDIKLGPSVFKSNIYSVVDNKNKVLPFIAKIELEISNKNTVKNKKRIEDEANVQSYAGLHGLAPKIYDFYACKHRSKEFYTILMERMEGVTLDDYIQKHRSVNSELKKKIKKVLDKLYDLGIRHDDMHGGNFILSNNKIFVIDFGDVKIYKNKVPSMERIYTIQINVENFGYLVVGREDPNIEKVKKEKLQKMKIAVNRAKRIGLTNEIANFEKMIIKLKKQNKLKMVKVYEKIINQKKDQIKKLF